jgi:outer membrane immunogenic protein
MRNLLLVSLAALALTSGSALAADMSAPPPMYKAPPNLAPVYSWTGFYLNAGGGYGLWDANVTTTSLAGGCIACATQTVGGKGYFGTVGGGFDYQFSDRIVAGLLADYDFMSLKGTIQDSAIPASGELKETSAWAAGARIGWLVTPQLLTYVNGGATGSRFGASTLNLTSGAAFGSTTPAFTKTGWFLGGGTETTLTPFLPAGWFLRGEYRYSSYGNSTVTESFGGAPLENINFKPYVQMISTSIVYKFNWTGR